MDLVNNRLQILGEMPPVAVTITCQPRSSPSAQCCPKEIIEYNHNKYIKILNCDKYTIFLDKKQDVFREGYSSKPKVSDHFKRFAHSAPVAFLILHKLTSISGAPSKL